MPSGITLETSVLTVPISPVGKEGRSYKGFVPSCHPVQQTQEGFFFGGGGRGSPIICLETFLTAHGLPQEAAGSECKRSGCLRKTPSLARRKRTLSRG